MPPWGGRDCVLARVKPMPGRVLEHWPDLPGGQAGWASYLLGASAEDLAARMHLRERTGRPLASRAFVAELERLLGRRPLPRKHGPEHKRKRKWNDV